MITFSNYVPIQDTMVFEKMFEKELRLTFENKKNIVMDSVCAWMFVGGKLAGEIYSISAKKMLVMEPENMEDLDDLRYLTDKTAYLYSISVLDKFQGHSYGELMYAYHLGQLYTHYNKLVGHATDCGATAHIAQKFGACMMQDCVHKNWYDTDRTARFYEHILRPSNLYQQTDDYSCGVYALKYWLKKHDFDIDANVLRLMVKPKKKTGSETKNIARTAQTLLHFVEWGSPITKIIKEMLPMLITQQDFSCSDVLHYTVLNSINNQEAVVFDPWTGREVKLTIDEFNKMWGADGNWGLYATK
jgi:hypothetical protein